MLIRNAKQQGFEQSGPSLIRLALGVICIISKIPFSSAAASLRLKDGILDPRSIEIKDNDSNGAEEGALCTVKNGVSMKAQDKEDEIIFREFFSKPPKCDGTVVEVGAVNGRLFSSSWFFQYGLGWETVLIEANLENFVELSTNRPDATNIFGAVCPDESLRFAMTDHVATGGGIDVMPEEMRKKLTSKGKSPIFNVPCLSLGAVLKKVKLTKVDLVFLDVSGGEYDALKTMDWSIPVDVWVVSMNGRKDSNEFKRLETQFRSHGYESPPELDLTKECRKHQANCRINEVFVLSEKLRSNRP